MRRTIASLLVFTGLIRGQEPPQAIPILQELEKAPLSEPIKDRARRALIAREYTAVEQILVGEARIKPAGWSGAPKPPVPVLAGPNRL